jgi:hypothetical protein
MLLGTVAAGSLWLYSAGTARAACAPDGPTILNCTGTIAGNVAPGVVGGGILVPNTYTTLNVYDLDANITPANNVDGIYFHRTGAGNAIVINSNTGPFDIIVNGLADGIDAISDAAVTIDHTGDIDASGAVFEGILARSTGASTDVMFHGGIIDAGDSGILARGAAGTTVTTDPGTTVRGGNGGITAFNGGTGALIVTANGDVEAFTSNGVGINARNLYGTETYLRINTGTGTTVSAGLYGIFALNNGIGAMEIVTNGDVETITRAGIYARNNNGTSLSITSQNVTGGLYGIRARNYGTRATTIVANGDVMGTGGRHLCAKQRRRC